MKTEQLWSGLNVLFDQAEAFETFEKDAYLFREGDESEKLFLLKAGQVKISKLSNDGNELTLRHSVPGDLVGELSLIEDDVTHILNAQMLTDGNVAVISKNVLKENLLQNGTLALEFIQLMSEYARRDQTRFRDLVMFGKKGALYSTLIRLANSYGYFDGRTIKITNRMTDQNLADFCGTSRESINRLMSELKRKKVISAARGYITIHDLDYLKTAINCGDCPLDICNIH
ncbi:Anaerobic regulatory protein [Lentibacillus sp. JNUCC-1]|uniref:Crp/Fnr family transcriptional regulator n=1 Tax=Lentibacillus sp. JNUCC-1 TaxID=2654513 RepID=UPI0013209D68|nr:Crp/Fnr family transcriptional regulator [Lentibacillus sp. JNUCC-1]MUV36335.1 Anaerobic regulatory protein [Lentibacillus sp. JNUCC-1]